MSKQTIARLQAAIMVIAPAVLFAALLYHPYIPNLTEQSAVADALVSDTTRWGVAHMAVAIGFGLMALAFLAVRRYLSEAGEERWSIVGLPFVLMGLALSMLLPAFEIAMLGAARVGADVAAVQGGLDPWFMPIFLSGAILSAIGVICFARAIVASGALSRGITWLVAAALVVIAIRRVAPLRSGLYIGRVAGIVALWPLANDVLNRAANARLASRYSSPRASSKVPT